jgi:hypothetical protein
VIRTITATTLLATALAFPAIAQNATVNAPSSTAVEKNTAALMLTEEQAKIWIDKPVYSSDGSKIGEVAAIARGTDNTVTEMQADIGGFLGMGETRVRLTPAQFKLQEDRAVLSVTATEAKTLPTVQK